MIEVARLDSPDPARAQAEVGDPKMLENRAGPAVKSSGESTRTRREDWFDEEAVVRVPQAHPTAAALYDFGRTRGVAGGDDATGMVWVWIWIVVVVAIAVVLFQKDLLTPGK